MDVKPNDNSAIKKGLLIGIPVLAVILLIVVISIIFNGNKRETEVNKDGEVSLQGVLGNLQIDVPEEFETSKSNDDSYKRYSYSNESDYCYMVMKSTQKGAYDSAKDYLEQNVYIEDVENADKVKEVEINKNKWSKLIIKDDVNKTEQYAILNGNIIYSIEYVISKDSGMCSKKIEKVIDSMKLN